MAGEVDRDAWAVVVHELLDLEAAPLEPGGKPRIHGAKTRLAAKVGLKTPRTIDTWLAKQVDVRESSVRAVADAYGLNAMGLLIRVGFYTVDELPVRLTDEQIDEEQLRVLDTDLADEVKVMILQELEAMRSTDERILEEQRARDRRRRDERIADLIAAARRVD